MTTKRHHVTFLLSCILAGLFLFGCDSITGGEVEIEYRVTPNGTSQVEQILYTDESGQEVELLDVALPWTKKITAEVGDQVALEVNIRLRSSGCNGLGVTMGMFQDGSRIQEASGRGSCSAGRMQYEVSKIVGAL